MNKDPHRATRRGFLKGAGLAGLATPLLAGSASAMAAKKTPSAKAKNLIFMVADGMCNGTLALAHHWHLRQKQERLHWMQLYDRSDLHRAFQDTASNSSPVTDSAAAASAWGSGKRVNNGSINIDAEGRTLTPIYVRAKQSGKRTGLVSTCRISHATPAGFVANVKDRDEEDEIVRQYLAREIDLLLGGGARHFLQTGKGGMGEASADYFRKFAAAGYRIVRNREQLKGFSASGEPVLGVFSDSHIPYAIDRKNDASLRSIPGLREMFAAALKQLNTSPEGFLLQVEAGRVDHAGHANDPAAILHELLEFDRCIPLALDYIQNHPDTLLIVTTDHGTGGCQLNGQGERYGDSGPALDRMQQFTRSFEWLERRFKASSRFDAAAFRMATGFDASEAQAAAIQSAIGNPEVKYLSSHMTGILEAELGALSATGWSSNNHTSENVELLAFGPGAGQLPAYLRNFELNGLVCDALGI